MSAEYSLRVEQLTVAYQRSAGLGSAVDEVSFNVPRGSIVGLIGETGSGKSTIARAVLGILPTGARVMSGKILLAGQDVVKTRGRALRTLRSNTGFVGQMPFGSLHPILPIGQQFYDKLRSHRSVTRRRSDDLACSLFDAVGLPSPKSILQRRVHELSGGMAQRVVIAFSLSNSPGLIIADEPTTALDVTIQRQILDLMQSIVQERQIGLLLITHDLSVVAQYCTSLVVLRTGQVVESGPCATVLGDPQHPYTRILVNEARRDLKATSRRGTSAPLSPVSGHELALEDDCGPARSE